LRFAWEPVYSRGLTKLVACGEKVTPARREITVYQTSAAIPSKNWIERAYKPQRGRISL
jgi:hypothetical protein